MLPKRASFFRATLALVCAGISCNAPASAKTIALLIGIGTSDGVGLTTTEQRDAVNLQGPPFDIAAMRQIVEQRMKVPPEDIRVLIDHQASRANIRAELAALMTRSQPGDTVLIYYSGHGTSQRDPNNNTGLPMGSSAWFPADFDWSNPQNMAARLISSRLDIRPLALEPLDRGGRSVIIISDSCFSGNISRGLGTKSGTIINKYIPVGDSEPMPEAVKAADFAPTVYPYQRVLMLSASADSEPAQDLAHSMASLTIDGKPKGALTNALLAVFNGKVAADYDHDGEVSFVELRRAVVEDLAKKNLAQSPQLLPALDQDPAGIIFAPVPGLAALDVPSRSEPLRVTIPAKASALGNALSTSGDFHLVPSGGAMVVSSGTRADSFSLATGSGDMIAEDAPATAIVSRLSAEAWARQLIAGAGAKVDLAADTKPAARGGTFVIDRDSVLLAMKAKQPVSYFVFDIAPNGRIVTLWPTSAAEDRPQLPGSVQTFGKTRVTEPAGLDHVVVLAFPQPPEGLSRFYGLNADFGSAEAKAAVQWLSAQRGTYAAATIDVRAVRACQAGGTAPCAR